MNLFGFLAMSWALSFGYVPLQTASVGAGYQQLDPNRTAFFSSVEIGATAWDILHVFTTIENYEYWQQNTIRFNPYRVNYICGASFDLTKNISIGIRHECDHPIISDIRRSASVYASDYNFASCETCVYAKLSSSSK